MIQDYLWDIIIREAHYWGFMNKAYKIGGKQDNTFFKNINRIADLLPLDVKKDFLKDMI